MCIVCTLKSLLQRHELLIQAFTIAIHHILKPRRKLTAETSNIIILVYNSNCLENVFLLPASDTGGGAIGRVRGTLPCFLRHCCLVLLRHYVVDCSSTSSLLQKWFPALSHCGSCQPEVRHMVGLSCVLQGPAICYDLGIFSALPPSVFRTLVNRSLAAFDYRCWDSHLPFLLLVLLSPMLSALMHTSHTK